MKVSVIIPVYNVEMYLRRCLESVAAQTFLTSEPEVEVECILVDDCGTDASMHIAREYVEAYSGPVQWRIATHSHNRGLSAARNTGLDMATGDYILFVDSDDELLPRALEALLTTARRYPQADMVQGDQLPVGEEKGGVRLNREWLPEFTDDTRWLADDFYLESPVMSWNKLYKATFIKANGFRFKEGIIHEDDDWQLKTCNHLSGVAYCKEFTYRYYINPESITRTTFLDKNHLSKLSIYREFFPKVSSRRIRHFMLITFAYMLADRDRLRKPADLLNKMRECEDDWAKNPLVPPYLKTAMRYLVSKSIVTKLWARLTNSQLYCLLVLIDRARRGTLLSDGKTKVGNIVAVKVKN